MAKPPGPRTPRPLPSIRPTARPPAAGARPSGDSPRQPTLRAPPPPREVDDDDEDVATRKYSPSRSSIEEIVGRSLDGTPPPPRIDRHQEKAAAKRAADEALARQEAAHDRRKLAVRAVVGLVVAVALAVGGYFGRVRYRRIVAADAVLSRMAAPYVATGWRAFDRPFFRARDRMDVTVGAHTCVVALASTSPGDGHLVVERPQGALTADGSLAYCVCADERVAVLSGPSGGVQLLYKESRRVGGNGALGFLAPRPAALPVREVCLVDALDAWLASGNGGSPIRDDGVAPDVRAALTGAGLRLVAAAPPEAPFAVVPAAPDTCHVAVATRPGGLLSLRAAGGATPIRVTGAPSPAAIGWCGHAPQIATVNHDASGDLAVFEAPASRVGGTVGLAEALARTRVPSLAAAPLWAAPTERGWDASVALLASGVLAADITIATDARPVTRARVVSLSTSGVAVAPEPGTPERYSCLPPLDARRSTVCVQSAPVGWRPGAGDRVGVAAAPLPFWMDLMSRVDDRAGLVTEAKLLELSRQLARDGYEATAREFAFEEKDGVEIVGRAREDRVVAVGLLASPPWVLPYSDGPGWALDGTPRAVRIAEGEHIHLVMRAPTATPAPATPSAPVRLPPPEVRRTVVFRHHSG